MVTVKYIHHDMEHIEIGDWNSMKRLYLKLLKAGHKATLIKRGY